MTDTLNRARIVQALKDLEACHYDIADTKSGKLCMYVAARHYGIPRFMPIQSFTTHKGDIVTGDKLQDALNHVADRYAASAHAMRESDDYASHVTESTKDENLHQGLKLADNVRKGHVEDFTTRQRINTYLTGECIAFLP